MCNASHTALSLGSGRIEDACGESPAASLFWLRSLVTFKLVVHYSFISRSLFVHYSFIICPLFAITDKNEQRTEMGSKRGSGGVSGGVPGVSWRVLGESRGPLGGVLGRLGPISITIFWQ